ncbi:MAG: serpin family protein [Eubacterium sp.]|nr:serpin family protein [Eubacterium sp.]
MKKRNAMRRLLPVALSLGFLLTGCGGEAASSAESTEEITLSAVNLAEGVQQTKAGEAVIPESHSRALSTGAVKLLTKTLEEAPDENVLISPLSLQMAFGMLTAGTTEGSVTEKELMEFLMPGETAVPADMNAEMATIAERMRSAEGVDWNVVNSVWLKKDGNVKLKDSFLSDAVNSYQAEFYSAPFDAGTVGEINAWVKYNTRERIPKIVDSLDPETSLVLVNALAFDGEWNTEVEPHKVKQNSDFNNADGSVSGVNMMQTEEHGYVQIAGGKGFLKSYKGGNYCFLGLLPPEGMTPEAYLLSVLSGQETLADAIRQADYEPTLKVSFPEFRAEYGTEMTKILQKSGVNKAFRPEAEFGNMITEDSEGVAVGEVVHRTMIEVDRTGTKAAAATEIAVTEAGFIDPETIVEISLDRPFIYGIIDRKAGIPVFLGVQNKAAHE